MSVYLILTVIGDDRPGLVERLSAAIGKQGGNWLESSMSHLAGKFAGIVRVAVDARQVEALKEALAALAELRITAEISESSEKTERRQFHLSLVGHDRIGIVREVSQILAQHAVNVEDLATHTSSAPMSAEILFHASATLSASPSLDVRELVQALERISNDLMVDIALDESIRS